jgi:hypothetical protein
MEPLGLSAMVGYGGLVMNWTAAATTALAAIAAWIAYRQSRINEEKLRFDLYNKRFEVYRSTVEFVNALHFLESAESVDAKHIAFVKSVWESEFLFDRSSGIHQLLNEMNSGSFKVLKFKETSAALQGMPQEQLKLYEDRMKSLEACGNGLGTLRRLMMPYLYFPSVSISMAPAWLRDRRLRKLELHP